VSGVGLEIEHINKVAHSSSPYEIKTVERYTLNRYQQAYSNFFFFILGLELRT
jgi:hypothetical protein